MSENEKKYQTKDKGYVMQGIKYEIPKEEYPELYEKAREKFREDYENERKAELEDARMQLEDGFITDITEYDEGEHLEFDDNGKLLPYDENKHLRKIENLAYEMFRNEHDLPKNIVIKIDAESAKEIPKERALPILNAHSKVMYGLKIKDLYECKKATNRDVSNYETYKSFMRLRKSEEYQKFVSLVDNIGKYSFNNRMLIWGQNPNATMVNGYKTWEKEYDRGCVKGAGITIYQPILTNLKTEDDVKAYTKKYGLTDTGFKKLLKEVEEKGNVTKHCGYSLTTVFDVMDTYAKDKNHDKLAELIERKKVFNGDNQKEVYTLVNDICKDYNAKILPYDYTDKVDCIYNNIYSLTDYLLKNHPEEIPGIKTMDVYTGIEHELEVLIATGAICSHLGIEADETINYGITRVLQNNSLKYTDKQEIFSKMFDRGYFLAQDFEKRFDEHIKEREKAKKKQKGVEIE